MIYKMQIPPFPVKSFDLLTTRQAKEIFKWYTDDIPARLDQLQKCIDADVDGTVQLTRGKDSLRPLWSWLVANIYGVTTITGVASEMKRALIAKGIL